MTPGRLPEEVRNIVTQHPIELILMRQLALHLATPAFVVDAARRLVAYNEAAAMLLGRPCEEAGEMPLAALSDMFVAADGSGRVARGEGPLDVSLEKQHAAHGRLHAGGSDSTVRAFTVSAFPLCGYRGRPVGAVALLWETDR